MSCEQRPTRTSVARPASTSSALIKSYLDFILYYMDVLEKVCKKALIYFFVSAASEISDVGVLPSTPSRNAIQCSNPNALRN